MDYNYHTHTTRCGHASGKDEDYIKKAIEAGIKHLGFSDHAPFIFPDGYEGNWRVPMAEAEGYVRDLNLLREKYKDKIKISIGFEMEYYTEHFDKMLEFVKKIGAEYLILGQHFILGEYPCGIGSIGPTDNAEYLKTYVDEVILAMKSGAFTYVAHPDIMRFTGDKDTYRYEITRLCLAAKEFNVPLEINMLGVRYKKHYPNEEFWQIVGETGAPVTIGIDAHNDADMLNKEPLKVAEQIIKKYSLNYIGKPKFISIT